MSKLFIFRCEMGKYPDTVKISYTKEDLDLMSEMIDPAKKRGTAYFAISKKGNPYCEVKDPAGRKPEHEDGGQARREDLGMLANDGPEPERPNGPVEEESLSELPF